MCRKTQKRGLFGLFIIQLGAKKIKVTKDGTLWRNGKKIGQKSLNAGKKVKLNLQKGLVTKKAFKKLWYPKMVLFGSTRVCFLVR